LSLLGGISIRMASMQFSSLVIGVCVLFTC
jgi:hypothetical protein